MLEGSSRFPISPCYLPSLIRSSSELLSFGLSTCFAKAGLFEGSRHATCLRWAPSVNDSYAVCAEGWDVSSVTTVFTPLDDFDALGGASLKFRRVRPDFAIFRICSARSRDSSSFSMSNYTTILGDTLVCTYILRYFNDH